MVEQVDSIKEFTQKFFTNLKCTLQWEGNILKVSNVPKDFEDFSGKSQPYLLAFDSKDSKDESELMITGSYLLRVMMSYIENKGQTTLLKLIFDLDIKENFLQDFILRNSTLSTLGRKQDYKTITRFTFLTTLQYLNEREQITTSISLRQGNTVNADIDKMSVVEGRKEDLPVKSLANDYDLAKQQLKTSISSKIAQVKSILNEQLQSEITRIKEHYGQQIKEYETSLDRLKQQIISLEREKSKAPDTSITESKIFKVKENIHIIETSGKLEKIKKEEDFFIKDEINKRGLSVSSKMMNTTIFYYPVYTITAFLKTSSGGRMIESSYDPIDKIWTDLHCEICHSTSKEIIICSSGHLTCANCASLCEMCSQIACSKCLEKACFKCSKKLCKKCTLKCTRCRKDVCTNHLRTLPDAPAVCVDCVRYCYACNKPSNPTQLRKNAKAQLVCQSCYNKEVNDLTLTRIFGK
jgi:hypothetical protein